MNQSINHFAAHITHTRRLSVKMDLLGMSAHPQFRFCLALDRVAMLQCDAQTTDKARKAFPDQVVGWWWACNFDQRVITMDIQKQATGQPVVRPHLVKPLQLIWSRFAWWNRANTLLVDDRPISFALNRASGILIRPFL